MLAMARKTAALTGCAARYWGSDNAATSGAALAFFCAFSLAPLLVILLAIAGWVVGATAAYTLIGEQLRSLFGPSTANILSGAVKSSRHAQGLIATVVSVIRNRLRSVQPHPSPPCCFGSITRRRSFCLARNSQRASAACAPILKRSPPNESLRPDRYRRVKLGQGNLHHSVDLDWTPRRSFGACYSAQSGSASSSTDENRGRLYHWSAGWR